MSIKAIYMEPSKKYANEISCLLLGEKLSFFQGTNELSLLIENVKSGCWSSLFATLTNECLFSFVISSKALSRSTWSRNGEVGSNKTKIS